MLCVFLVAVMANPLYASEGTESDPITVGSKMFPESRILGEIMSQLLEAEGYVVDRRFGLGGTIVCYRALIADEIDVYPEYSGTIAQAILELQERLSLEEINEKLAALEIEALSEFGFNNTYAMAMRREMSEELGVTKVSQLVDHPNLKYVVSHEFLDREDGWPHLERVYGLRSLPTGIEHTLAYRAMADGSIDVTDGYSTDAELVRYDLVVLEDDRGAFPLYMALPLIRSDLSSAIQQTLDQVGGMIDEATMLELNRQAVVEGKFVGEIASGFLASLESDASADSDIEEEPIPETGWNSRFFKELRTNTLRHLELTGIALIAATIVALLLSLAVYRISWLARSVVYVCGLLQTIPSLALLALLIPLVGIGMLPAIIALFLYSLLPIVRNTVTSLTTVDPMLIRVAEAMGMSQYERLRFVMVPLAMPSVFAGIRTSAVICIGTATLAAFIGAGGLGNPIITGLSMNSPGLILEGAIPAAILAILTELVFEFVERMVIPGHLKIFGATKTDPATET